MAESILDGSGRSGIYLVLFPASASDLRPLPASRFGSCYAIPSDREFKQEYSEGIRRAIELLQWWYAEQLGGPTFAIHNAEPEPCYMSEPESFYLEDAWLNTIDGVQHCAPVWHDRAEFISVVYVDIWEPLPLDVVVQGAEACAGARPARIGGATEGLAVLPAADLYGLITPRFNVCGWETGIDRWIGGLGHELGHALGVPHPPGCDEGLPSCDVEALMWLGYDDWPHTHLRDEEKARLLASPFIR